MSPYLSWKFTPWHDFYYLAQWLACKWTRSKNHYYLAYTFQKKKMPSYWEDEGDHHTTQIHHGFILSFFLRVLLSSSLKLINKNNLVTQDYGI